MNDEVKLWLEILTSGKIAIEADQARAILWLAIWHAAQSLACARAAAPVAKPAKAPKPVVAQVLAAIKAGAASYEDLRKACPKIDPRRLYRACDQLVQRNQIARTRTQMGVSLAAR